MKTGLKRSMMFAWATCSVLALLGLYTIIAGISGNTATLVFTGLVMLAMACLCLLYEWVIRSGDESTPMSRAEKAAWTALSLCIVNLLILGQMVGGMFRIGLAAYLLLAACAVVVLFYPAYRRQWLEKDLRRREVLEDERDLAIRKQGEYWAKRTLEFELVAVALLVLVYPQILSASRNPFQICGLLMALMLSANAAGEARTALLYWRDRQ